MAESKWNALSEELRSEILESAKEIGASKTATDYAPQIGINRQNLYERLLKYIKQLHNPTSEATPTPQKVEEKKEIKLSRKEKEFLKGLQNGSVTLEEASRLVAHKVFEKMLKNPDDFKFVDFFKTELLKIKQTEVQDRNNWAMELINRMFAGKLPPRFCPKCGHEVIKITDPHIPQRTDLIKNPSGVLEGTVIPSGEGG